MIQIRVFLKCVGAIFFTGCTGVDVDALYSWARVVFACGAYAYPKKERKKERKLQCCQHCDYGVASFSSSSKTICNPN